MGILKEGILGSSSQTLPGSFKYGFPWAGVPRLHTHSLMFPVIIGGLFPVNTNRTLDMNLIIRLGQMPNLRPRTLAKETECLHWTHFSPMTIQVRIILKHMS